jgi:hypothetical protein
MKRFIPAQDTSGHDEGEGAICTGA